MENGVSVLGYMIRIHNVRFKVQDIENGIRYKIEVGKFLLYELKKRDLIMLCVNSLLCYCLYYLKINFILKGFTNTETKKQLVYARCISIYHLCKFWLLKAMSLLRILYRR